MSTRKQHIAVISAGPSGILAARTLLENAQVGLYVTIFGDPDGM